MPEEPESLPPLKDSSRLFLNGAPKRLQEDEARTAKRRPDFIDFLARKVGITRMRLDKMRDRRLNRSIRQLARLYFLVENRPKQAAKLKAEWRMNVLLNSIRTQLRQRPKIYFHRKRNR